MLSPNTIQAAMLALLKANLPLTTALGGAAAIKEAEWHGTGFTYPACRLDLSDVRPDGTGACAEEWGGLVGRIVVYSKQDSSSECLTLLGLVQDAIQRRRLTGAGLTSLEIKIDSTVLPYLEGGVWRGDVVIYTTAIPA
jgi:hypothetical protein